MCDKNVVKGSTDRFCLFNQIRNLFSLRSKRYSIKSITNSDNRITSSVSEITENNVRNKELINELKSQCATLAIRLQTVHWELILSRLYSYHVNGRKIRIGFYVIFDGIFPAASVFEKFIEDKDFEAFILVIPDVSRGEEHMLDQLYKTYNGLKKRYKNVYMSYDEKTRTFIDFSDKNDIVFFANPYDIMTYEYYGIDTLVNKNKLTLYTNYGYQTSNSTGKMFGFYYFKKLWKIFLLDKHEQELLLANNPIATNGHLVGYSKLDRLASIEKKLRSRKKIIIAPHHTVDSIRKDLALSTFLSYSNFFLTLFKKYTNIDFVFRPHPLLWIQLERYNIWTEQQIHEYLSRISELENVEYQGGGDYLETFVNSDALIHDCGSFAAEYLFVNKPCCFLLKNDAMMDLNSNDFHKKCISLHYPAYNEQDIIDFIENMVIRNNDNKVQDRQNFVQTELMFKHPNVSMEIYKLIKHDIGI